MVEDKNGLQTPSKSSKEFQADLANKLVEDLDLKDFKNKSCNCNNASLVFGQCSYKNDCQKTVLSTIQNVEFSKNPIPETHNHITRNVLMVTLGTYRKKLF